MSRIAYFLSSVALCAGVASAQEASLDRTYPVVGVVLSDTGLAEFRRTVPADRFKDGSERIEMSFRVGDMNDALKSFSVSGTDVTGASLSAPSLRATDKSSASLFFGPDDIAQNARLLDRLKGHPITIVSNVGKKKVLVLGVDQRDTGDVEHARPSVLSFQGEDGQIGTALIDENFAFELVDAADKAHLKQVLDLVSKRGRDGLVDVAVNVQAGGQQDVDVFALVQALPWRASYRGLVDAQGTLDLQGWAVLENDTGEDWTDVSLSLTSGSPQMVPAPLYEDVYQTYAVSAPMARGGMMASEMALQADSAASMSPLMKYVEESDRLNAAAGARFDIKKRMNVPAGDLVSFPFLADDIDARVVARVALGVMGDGERLQDVPLALDVRNDTGVRLPDGVVSLRDARLGFVGDVSLTAVDAGSHHTLTFANRSGVRAAKTTEYGQQLVGAQVAEGVLRVRKQTRSIDTVSIEGAGDRAMEVVIDIPAIKNENVRVTGPSDDVETQVINQGERVVRVAHTVGAGEAVSFEVERTRVVSETMDLGNITDESLLQLSAGTRMNAAWQAWVEKGLSLYASQADVAVRIEAEQAARAQIVEDQDRRARLLGAAPNGNALQGRLSAQIAQGEDEVSALDEKIADLESDLKKAQDAFRAHVRELPEV